jgi:hypothetical protein
LRTRLATFNRTLPGTEVYLHWINVFFMHAIAQRFPPLPANQAGSRALH